MNRLGILGMMAINAIPVTIINHAGIDIKNYAGMVSNCVLYGVEQTQAVENTGKVLTVNCSYGYRSSEKPENLEGVTVHFDLSEMERRGDNLIYG